MQHFHVLYPDPEVAPILDKMRIIAKGEISWPAHVTVAGPFKNTNIPRNKSIKIKAKIEGIETKCNGENYIVWIRLGGDFRRIWKKRDYPDGVPHITIYEGRNKEWSKKVLRALEAINEIIGKTIYLDRFDILAKKDQNKVYFLARSLLRANDTDQSRLAEFILDYVNQIASQPLNERERALKELAQEFVSVLKKSEREK